MCVRGREGGEGHCDGGAVVGGGAAGVVVGAWLEVSWSWRVGGASGAGVRVVGLVGHVAHESEQKVKRSSS